MIILFGPGSNIKYSIHMARQFTDALTIGYNAEYLKDVVSHVSGDKVIAEFSTSISAALFSPESTEDHIDSLMLLMPIRLND